MEMLFVVIALLLGLAHTDCCIYIQKLLFKSSILKKEKTGVSTKLIN